jgi:hypothetical protein
MKTLMTNVRGDSGNIVHFGDNGDNDDNWGPYRGYIDRNFDCKEMVKVKKGKDIPVTGRGGPLGCERPRLPHYLDKRVTDGGKVISPTRRPPFTPRFLF